MNASSAKTFGIVLVALLALALLWPLKYLFFAPVGVAHGLSAGWHGMHAGNWVWPWVGFAGLFGLLVLGFWIAVLVWVYRDAEKHGMNALLWTAVVFFVHFIGFVIYLLVRTDHPVRAPQAPPASGPIVPTVAAPPGCPKCGKTIDLQHSFCPACGERIKPVCPACGKDVQAGWKACPNCGGSL
ncbi:MAG: zinc ribbon domain-containing protein [Acidobacteriota bacterium]|nr:zinc ribbon domain-containing protein [Acidobacteriota bacterium]